MKNLKIISLLLLAIIFISGCLTSKNSFPGHLKNYQPVSKELLDRGEPKNTASIHSTKSPVLAVALIVFNYNKRTQQVLTILQLLVAVK